MPNLTTICQQLFAKKKQLGFLFTEGHVRQSSRHHGVRSTCRGILRRHSRISVTAYDTSTSRRTWGGGPKLERVPARAGAMLKL